MEGTERIPMLPLRGMVVFPSMIIHLDAGRVRSVGAVEQAMLLERRVLLVAQKNAEIEEPAQGDLFTVGTIAEVRQLFKLPGGALRVLVEGTGRAQIRQVRVLEKYDEAEKDHQLLIKERDEYKNKLDDIIKKKINKEKEYKFKSNLLALINTSQIHIKKKIAKKETKRFNMNNYLEEKTYDFLCLRYEKTIIDSLKDSHYDTFTVFSESINYVLDQNKKVIQECILFITMEYFYLYNTNYKCCFACPLIELVFVSFSNNNNYLSFIFQRSENVIFETFRILELVNFMRLLKAKRKTLNFAIESESYVFNEQKGNKKNYIENLYFGKGSFSGSFKKEVTSMKGLYNHYEDRFGVLCDVGLIIFESPNGKPKEIINLLFADVGFIIGEKTKLDIKVREKIHRFWFKTEWIRNEWKKKIDFWKKSNSNLTKFN